MLQTLGLLGTAAEERFDRVTRLAVKLFDVPIALVTLLDADRQWFKANTGLDASETPREHSFCAHAIASSEILQVPDATIDPRFQENPLVTGDPEIRFYAGCPVRAPNGVPVGTVCVIDRVPREMEASDLDALRDLAAIVEDEISANYRASVDALTGLTNRRGFMDAATQMLAYARRHNEAFSVVVIDLDDLKVINDIHGHGAGDEALREVAAILRRTQRDADVGARLGGDEFGFALPGTDRRGAEALMERLKRETERQSSGRPWSVSLSAGTATATADMREGDVISLIAQADRAMYVVKRRKRIRPAGSTALSLRPDSHTRTENSA